MGRNTSKLYYPIKESILSILPIVDEFVIALGDCDEDDRTLEIIEEINSDKIKIIHTEWDSENYLHGTIYAHQTDIAMKACTGDWLFYLQSDEVVHERYLAHIQENCERYLNDQEVEGFLFNYKHFYGDYNHYNDRYGWYPNEIRVVRNLPDMHSFGDAQSFRRIPDFEPNNFESYREKEGTHKLKVIALEADIYHYGWVRPPQMMQTKQKVFASYYSGKRNAEKGYEHAPQVFDYGNLSKLALFEGCHPKVMEDFISRFNWGEQLHYELNYKPTRPLQKHETRKAALLTYFKRKFYKNKRFPIGYSNWKVIGEAK